MTCLESLDPALIRVGMRTRLILKLLEDALHELGPEDVAGPDEGLW